MAVTILTERIPVAGGSGAAFTNAVVEAVRLYGASVANTDTGTYTPTRKPYKNSAGDVVIVGLPHNITAAESGGVITFTNGTGGTLTSLNLHVFILTVK